MRFASREDAGGNSDNTAGTVLEVDLVLGLPRAGAGCRGSGAPVEPPLDALIVRKIGHPWHREFAVGALAEPDVVVLDEASVGKIRCFVFNWTR